jgi:hypothetical protein
LEKDTADGDFDWSGRQQGSHCLHWSSAKAQVLSQSVGGAERDNAQGYLGSDEGLQHLMDCAIAAAGEDGVVAIADGSQSQIFSTPRSVGLKCVGFDSLFAKDGERALDVRGATCRVLS